jgi:hypothetical protein
LSNLSGNYDTHPQLIGDGAVSSLTIAIRQFDAVTCRLATIALTNLAAVVANHQVFYERAPSIEVREPKKKKRPSSRDSFSTEGDEEDIDGDATVDGESTGEVDDEVSELDIDDEDVDCFEFLVDVASGASRGWTTLGEAGTGDPVAEAGNAARAAAKQCDVSYDLYNELKQAYEKSKEESDQLLLITGVPDPVLASQVQEYEVNAKQALAEAEVDASMKRRARKNWSEAEVVRDLGYDLDARCVSMYLCFQYKCPA